MSNIKEQICNIYLRAGLIYRYGSNDPNAVKLIGLFKILDRIYRNVSNLSNDELSEELKKTGTLDLVLQIIKDIQEIPDIPNPKSSDSK